MAKVTVTVSSAKPRYAFGEPVTLAYAVANKSQAPVWVVDDPDRVVAWKEGADGLRVLCGVPRRGVPFEYFEFGAPALRRLAPGAQFKSQVRVGMPLTATVVDRAGVAGRAPIGLNGTVTAVLYVGYGAKRFVPKSTDPMGEFLAWQQLAQSKPLKLVLAAPGPILPRVP